MIKWVKFEHTIIFFVVANLLVWGSWHLFLKPEKRHQAKVTAIQEKAQQEQQLLIQYDSILYKAQEKTQQQLPMQHDMNKSVPLNMQKKTQQSYAKFRATEKSIPLENEAKALSKVKADEAQQNWFTTYWPYVVSVCTSVPSIIMKWKEMYGKIFKKKKHKKHKR